MKKPVFSSSFRKSCQLIADQCYGRKGVWAYDSFFFINRNYFSDRLPCPLILWGLTPHGHCIAWTSSVSDKSRAPIINLHPSLLGGTGRANPWNMPANWLGPAYAFDTLLHECIHIHIEYNLGGHDGPTSHNCSRWIRQVNRIAPLLGYNGIRMGTSKTKRIPDHSAPLTARGKPATRVVRVSTGNVPFKIAAGFPASLRFYQGEGESYYGAGSLPEGATSL